MFVTLHFLLWGHPIVLLPCTIPPSACTRLVHYTSQRQSTSYLTMSNTITSWIKACMETYKDREEWFEDRVASWVAWLKLLSWFIGRQVHDGHDFPALVLFFYEISFGCFRNGFQPVRIVQRGVSLSSGMGVYLCPRFCCWWFDERFKVTLIIISARNKWGPDLCPLVENSL